MGICLHCLELVLQLVRQKGVEGYRRSVLTVVPDVARWKQDLLRKQMRASSTPVWPQWDRVRAVKGPASQRSSWCVKWDELIWSPHRCRGALELCAMSSRGGPPPSNSTRTAAQESYICWRYDLAHFLLHRSQDWCDGSWRGYNSHQVRVKDRC